METQTRPGFCITEGCENQRDMKTTDSANRAKARGLYKSAYLQFLQHGDSSFDVVHPLKNPKRHRSQTTRKS